MLLILPTMASPSSRCKGKHSAENTGILAAFCVLCESNNSCNNVLKQINIPTTLLKASILSSPRLQEVPVVSLTQQLFPNSKQLMGHWEKLWKIQTHAAPELSWSLKTHGNKGLEWWAIASVRALVPKKKFCCHRRSFSGEPAHLGAVRDQKHWLCFWERRHLSTQPARADVGGRRASSHLVHPGRHQNHHFWQKFSSLHSEHNP